eukprot:CAMPEP_0206165358 /NCGR_PEP_ID=MMETSP1474-20131121/20110_1 /ASSEMBLY_ACC=CAM_ASM_001110 /TAXON_ID=97495 /ORGANISM="Imantonia sp., Strain RCC918" /LENGTH=75 /DNA_ID=CAMNT_0053568691 /DNA_START=263 /DNA_END=490 /DNA_ORIENTATION=-
MREAQPGAHVQLQHKHADVAQRFRHRRRQVGEFIPLAALAVDLQRVDEAALCVLQHERVEVSNFAQPVAVLPAPV